MMSQFWKYAAMMLRYKRLLVLAGLGVALDACCAVGGYGTLTWIISVFFEKNQTIHELLRQKLEALLLTRHIDLRGILSWVPQDPMRGLGFALGMILLFAVVGSLGRYLHEFSTITVSLRTVMRIRKAIFTRLVHLPMAIAGRSSTAEQVSKVVRDCQLLSAGFTALTSRAVRGVVVGMALLLYALYYDWALTMTFMLVIPPIVVIINKFGKKIRRASRKALREYGVMLGGIMEAMHGLRVVKVHHAEGYERRRFNTINRRVLAQQLKARTARAMGAPVVETLGLVGVMLVMLVAAWSVYHLGREAKELVAVMLVLVGSASSFRTLTTMNNSLNEAAAAAASIDEVLHLPIEHPARSDDQRERKRLARHHRSIEFQGITFTYPGAERQALRGVDLVVPHGKVCAIVGGNGSGKSTLLGLIPRLYEPQSGRVLVDGVDIAQVSLRSLRHQIAVVTQETVLFEGSIAENIGYGRRHTPREAIIAAARRAHAHEFIQNIPEGYDSNVGERGQRLSGGQRQRLAIARAVLRDPAILILDEATSQIDSDSEAKITEAIAEFVRNRTTLIIAHRLSTVINADMIAVMHEGHLVAIGKHRELLANCEEYRLLCRTQLHGLEPEPAA